MFDHFLITRFNLKTETWKFNKTGKPVLTAEWMENRYRLFERFTLPSVLNQSNKNFRWLIYFDIDTPEKYKNNAIQLTKTYSNICVFFIEGMPVFLNSIKSSILQFKNKGQNFLITTRLDNDDIIHKDFIKTIQGHFIPQKKYLIDLRRGYQIYLAKQGRVAIRHFYDYYTHFLSLIEDSKDFTTVFSRIIDDWQQETNVIAYHKTALFIELIHEENLVNNIKYHQPYSINFNASDFGIDKSYLKFKNIFWIVFKNRNYYLKRLGLFPRKVQIQIS